MQAVALRWRALAYTHAKGSSENFDESFRKAVKDLADKVVDGLEAILKFAGARPPLSSGSKRSSIFALKRGAIVGDAFDKRVEAVIERASRIATTIVEGVRSVFCDVVTEAEAKPIVRRISIIKV